MPQLSWPNSTNFENSVLAQIQSAKLESLLDEYNDTEMSTEEKVNYIHYRNVFLMTYHLSFFPRTLTLIAVSNTPISHAHLH